MLEAVVPSKIELYINTDRKTIGQIKTEKNCKYAINAGIFDLNTFTPNCHVKSNGVVYHTEEWSRWGLAWNNDDKTFHWDMSMDNSDNYLDCVELIKDGQMLPLTYVDGNKTVPTYPSGMAGECDRTAIGFNDGTLLIYCSKDNDTPESLQSKLYYLGWKNAMLLDGGGSSQGISPSDVVTSERIVYSLFLIYQQLYCVQMGAFLSEDNATNLCNEIKGLYDSIGAGYANAYVKLINGLYKVQVGAFSVPENAQKVIDDLKSKGYQAFVTVR